RQQHSCFSSAELIITMVVVHFGGLRFEEGLDGSFIGESDPSFSQLEYQKLWP
ncbi:unnamed protein product, partial [Heterosigma akashiwo]